METEKKIASKKRMIKKAVDTGTYLRAMSILIGAMMISVSIVFAGKGYSFSTGNSDDTNTVATGECSGDNRLGEGCYVKYAQDLELDEDEFNACMETEKHFDIIDKELAAGEQYGVQGTPSFYIGKGSGDEFQGFYVGAVRLEEIRTIIERLESGSVEDANKVWIDYLNKSLIDYEPNVREYYSSAEGGSLTGEELETTVSQFMSERAEQIKTDYIIRTMNIGDGQVIGDAETDIVMMEFSDYECPYCYSFANDVLVDAKKDFVDSGRAKYVYRDFPLENIHPKAKAAANAARCAGEQGKYFEYHDKLFSI